MSRSKFATTFLAAWVIQTLILGASVMAAGVSLTERKAIQSANAAVTEAGQQFAAGNYVEAGKKIRVAMEHIETANQADSAEVHDLLLPAMKRVRKAHAMLQFEGVTLPPFRIPSRPDESPMETESPMVTESASKPMPASKPVSEPKPTDPNAISFTSTVAPILANRCGGCHISGAKGGFSLVTFAALMKGPPEGVVIFAGDTIGSRLIETIETGDMPRGGGRVSAGELQTLKAWIMQGAKFDGADPNVPITGGPAAAAMADEKPMEVQRATGNETVSFAADVAPLLLDNCSGCHVDAMQTRGGLNMNTFAQLLRGGDSGGLVTPGSGEASLLVKKLRGTEGDRMPGGGRPPLSEESIALISTWIDEGAKLDGTSENQPIRVMSQLAWVASASAEEVSARRSELADRNFRLANASSAKVAEKETDHFRVLGTASQATIDLVAKLAEAQMKTVRGVVKAESGEGFFDGRATIFVLPRRYDYSEFAKMVERRGVPSDWQSHWEFDGIDAYVAMVATDRDEEEAIESRLLGPLTALAVATRGGDVPRWLAEGVGVATASRKRGSDREQRRQLEAEISQAIAAMGDAKRFLDGKVTPEQSDRIGAAIATALMDRTHRRNFDRVLRELDEGKSFEAAFSSSFGVPPKDFVEAWVKWVRGG